VAAVGKPTSILYVDDDPVVLEAMARVFRACGAEVTSFLEVRDAVAHLERGPWTIVMSDFNMPHMDGIDFMRTAVSTCPSARRILLTGSVEHPKVTAARVEGLVEVIPKAAELQTLLDRLGLAPGGRR
jgi:CheY-like chemotaxis protein